MKVLVTGANGFVGKALTMRLLASGVLKGKPISKLILMDRVFEENFIEACTHSTIETVWHSGDLANGTWLRSLVAQQTLDTIFHLASVPGGMAEQNETLARRVNIGATETLLDICKEQSLSAFAPVFVFASSIAVFGTMTEKVTDHTALSPQMSYGAHKVIGEVMINDFSRRGWVDGRSLRLPGVLARPPAKTGQLSAFLSDIIRELSQGNPFACPMSPSATTWASSLPNIVDNLLHAATVESDLLTYERAVTLPTLCFTMAELVHAIGEAFSQPTEELVTYSPDAHIERLFGAFPALETAKADKLGYQHDGDLLNLVKKALREINGIDRIESRCSSKGS